MNNENIESRLYFTKNALDTVLSNPIKSKLMEFGYDDEKLQKGLKFFEKANALHHQFINWFRFAITIYFKMAFYQRIGLKKCEPIKMQGDKVCFTIYRIKCVGHILLFAI